MLSRRIDSTNNTIVPRSKVTKDSKSRLKKYRQWLESTGRNWLQPDLDEYRDYLLQTLHPNSVYTHLNTVRSTLRYLSRQPSTRDLFLEIAHEALVRDGQEITPANLSAYSRELEVRFLNAIHPRESKVNRTYMLHKADGDHLRLTKDQVYALLGKPNTNTLRGKRDKALMALIVCTGIRAQEAASVKVDDLYQTMMGIPALVVRHGKRNVQRLVPYGGLDWCLPMVESWLQSAGIKGGYIFRGMYKGRGVRSSKITTRGINLIFTGYPIDIDGQVRHVNPHDLRRTYARQLYDAGVDIVAIQQNLGHAYIRETLDYIGELHASQRVPPSVF